MKPDVTGVEIIAAFSPMASPSGKSWDKRSVKYNILSGTSMSCPHVAAAAAFVKSFHPTWSPSAIKSALMTTAREIIVVQDKDAEFAYGSGHIDPLKAKDPDLVYEILKEDYLKMWCSVSQGIESLTGIKASCQLKLMPKELNYPSMVVQVDTKSAFVVSFSRTLTNVGRANSTYVASIEGGSKLHVVVKPNILQFMQVNQKISFIVTVRGKRIKSSLTMMHMSLVWTDGIHKVRSPIVVYTGTSTSFGERTSTPLSFYKLFITFLVVVLLYQKS